MTEARETVVVAGNQLGKDFTAAFIALTFFIAPQLYFDEEYVAQVERTKVPGQPHWLTHFRRVVTTSVKEKHIDVLWAEIGRYLGNSQVPLLESRGGPLTVNALEIRFAAEKEVKKPLSYLLGCVSEKGEGLSGHHSPYNLLIVDEASGVDDSVYEMGQGWAKRFLIFGNPNPCDTFFRKMVQGGSVKAS